jgi:glycosyltransferase involved in cell wall biosynthesis
VEPFISIIIPNRNADATIEKCLEAIFTLDDRNFEVVVVDDASEDNSVKIIKKLPCRLIRLEKHSGPSKARNIGAQNSRGDILFFTDADCLLPQDGLSLVRKTLAGHGSDIVLGGTYTQVPYDHGFFSAFQSAFINYSESKNWKRPDYVATHAMVIRAETFKGIGGFSEDFLPLLEDVELSHRLRRAGYRLMIDPGFQVRHIFNYSLKKSFRNAIRKTKYWILYSLQNRDLFADSGTASAEMKVNGASWLLTGILIVLGLVSGEARMLTPLPLIWTVNAFVNRKLFRAFYKARGAYFFAASVFYYALMYPAAVWTGAFKGLIQYYMMDNPWLDRKNLKSIFQKH